MNIKNLRVFLCLFLLGVGLTVKAENQDSVPAVQENPNTIEDPLIQQYFCVDSKTEHLVVLDTAENKVVILKCNTDNLDTVRTVLVDVVRKRHDVDMIYRPKSVAIYDGNVVFLASNRDSSYISVLSLKGEQIYLSPKFSGAATAFSYNQVTKKLYIAGLNAAGFNVFDIDVSKGFSNIKIDSVSTPEATYLNYQIPKKSEQMGEHDPYGVALTVIAMTTVFFALFIISVFLMGLSRGLKKMQQSRALKKAPQEDKQEIKAKVKTEEEAAGDVIAAISAAIYMYNDELHDEENTILTINKVNRRYSPWASKINNMNVYTRR